MKKYILPLALIALFSCQKEANVPTGAPTVKLTLTTESAETRTFIEQSGTTWLPYWDANDVLGVMVDDAYDKPYSLTNTVPAPGRTGTFTGTIEATDGEHTLTAWYPKDLKAGRNESVIKYVLATEQNPTSLTTFDPSLDLLVGLPETFTVTNGTANVDAMRFRRVFAVVKVTLKDQTTGLANTLVTRVALTGASTLAGKANVEITTGDITKWEDATTTVAGNFPNGFAIDGTSSVYLLVNPTTLASGSNLTVDVTTTNDQILVSKSITLPNDVVFAENKVTTLNITLEDKNIVDKNAVVSYDWDFSSAEWQAALSQQASAACAETNGNSAVTNWSASLNGLTYTSVKSGKWSTNGYIQTGGAGTASDRAFSFTAPSDGTLKVTASNTGKDAVTDRYVTVSTGGSTTDQVGGSASSAPTTLTFEVKAGAVKIYPTGNGLRFYRITYTSGNSSNPNNPNDPTVPTPGGQYDELECPNPPTTGDVPVDQLYGYGKGVTGGAGATASNILHFDNGKAFQTWLLARTKSEKNGDHSPVEIWLSGTFTSDQGRDFSEAHPWFDVKDVSNLSIYGTDGFVMDRIGIFLVRANNIIIRNINFQQPKANNGADAVSMQEADGVWIDHCTFTSLNQTKDYEDGSTDITHGSKNVTVSWCRYIKTQKSCLVGHSNNQSSDTQITATFHHNWFDGSSSRHPRVRFGNVHVYNNLFDGCTTYGVGSAYGAKVLVEYNYFDGVQLPTDICTYPAKESNESNLQGKVAGYLYATQDVFVNRPAKAKDPYPLTNVQYTAYNGSTITPLTYNDFKPAYDYIVTPAEDVPTVVKGGAGHGKLGWTDAPVAVNNAGITQFNGTDEDPTNPDQGDEDEPTTPATGLADGWNWTANNANTSSYGVTNGQLSITSTGKWESKAQGFGAIWREYTGDFTATVKLVSYDPKKTGSNQAAAGLLIVDGDITSTTTNLVYAMAGGSYYGNFRAATGSDKSGFSLSAPSTTGGDVILKMVREGNKVKFSYSLDGGATFGNASSKEFTSLGSTVKIGLVANSGDNSKTSTAVFESFTVGDTVIAF